MRYREARASGVDFSLFFEEGRVFPIFSQKSNRWRAFYNPLRGLSLPKLVSLLEAGERGQLYWAAR